MSRKASFKGIPKQYLGAVQLVMGNRLAMGKKVSPQFAYAYILAGKKKDAERKAEVEKAKAMERAKEEMLEAREAFNPAFSNLTTVRDLLTRITDPEADDYMDYHAQIQLARALMVESIAKIEQAAFTLGIPCYSKNRGDEGWFVANYQ